MRLINNGFFCRICSQVPEIRRKGKQSRLLRHNYSGNHLKHYGLLPSACEGYVFTGVCLSTGGVCLSAYWDTTPPEQTSPRETATAADGTHPTGMHSCSHCTGLGPGAVQETGLVHEETMGPCLCLETI